MITTPQRQSTALPRSTLPQVDAFQVAEHLTVAHQMRRAQVAWWLMFVGLLGVSGFANLLMMRNGDLLQMICWQIYVGGVLATLYRPRFGLYIILGFTLVSDIWLFYWLPFTKNFSSPESLLYLNDALIISPLETFIAITVFSWVGRMAMERRWLIRMGPLVWMALLFGAFAVYGLGYGIVRGGIPVIALWESRAIFYMVALVVLATNLIDSPRQINRLLWIAAIALFIKAVRGVWYVIVELQFDLTGVERIGEHAMSIQFNSIYIMAAAAWIFHDSFARRLALPLMIPPILLSYFANQRRASFLTLGVGLVLVAFVLFHYRRKLFWLIVPPLSVLAMVYVAIFWNASGTLGMPASAIKSVIGQADARDAASNIYRERENANIMFTIQNAPITGIGFGNKFYVIAPMADISFFEWYEYITHNSIMWIWMKMGLGGFLALLLLVSTAITIGARAIFFVGQPVLKTAALTATLYLLMHFTYAYADMSWETVSMVYVGTMIGIVGRLRALNEVPVVVPVQRWPWQIWPIQARVAGRRHEAAILEAPHG